MQQPALRSISEGSRILKRVLYVRVDVSTSAAGSSQLPRFRSVFSVDRWVHGWGKRGLHVWAQRPLGRGKASRLRRRGAHDPSRRYVQTPSENRGTGREDAPQAPGESLAVLLVAAVEGPSMTQGRASLLASCRRTGTRAEVPEGGGEHPSPLVRVCVAPAFPRCGPKPYSGGGTGRCGRNREERLREQLGCGSRARSREAGEQVTGTWRALRRVRLSEAPWTVPGNLQARILEWVAFAFSRGSSQRRDGTQVSCIAGRFFTS